MFMNLQYFHKKSLKNHGYNISVVAVSIESFIFFRFVKLVCEVKFCNVTFKRLGGHLKVLRSYFGVK